MSNQSKWYLAFKYWKKTNLSKFRGRPIDETFIDIYKNNFWNSKESVSGKGSDFLQTETIVQEIPKLLEKFKVSTMHDIPCGDFNWMKQVELKGVHYLGSDIVPELIDANTKNFSSSSINFKLTDITNDSLPMVDLIFTRDCLVHFSYDDTRRALLNIIASGSKYLLATSYVERERNYDIATGEWRPINLERKPYNFPTPLLSIIENSTEDDGENPDKSLLLWEIKEVAKSVFL